MNIEQLKAIKAISREGGFSKAARKLFITQPALSMQIRALEEEVGAILFERSKRTVLITEAGRLLLAHANDILVQLDAVKLEIQELQGLKAGQVSIASSDTITRFLLLPVIAQFTARYPGIRTKIWNKTSPEIVAMVLDGMADIGILTLPVPEQGLEIIALHEYRDVAVSSRTSALFGKKQVELSQLQRMNLLLLEHGTRSRSRIETAFRSANIPLTSYMDLGTAEVQKELAKIGTGVAIVPDFSVREEQKTGQLWVSHIKGMQRNIIALIRRRTKNKPAAVQAFSEVLFKVIDKPKSLT